jgi:hypothetical protein
MRTSLFLSTFAAMMLVWTSVTTPAEPPAAAPEPTTHTFSELPQDLLEQGVQTAAVCMLIDGYGIRRMMTFYNTNKADSTGTGSTAEKAAEDSQALYADFRMEEALAKMLTDALKGKGLNDQKMHDMLDDMLNATKDSLKDKYDSMDEFEVFEKAYVEPTNHCSDVTISWANKVKSYFDDLDSKKN